MHVQRLIGTKLAAALSEFQWPAGSPAVQAIWRRIPDFGVEDLGTLKVSVIPGPITVNEGIVPPRGADWFQASVGIVIAKHVGSEQEIADLEDLNMAIVDAIRSNLLVLEDVPPSTDWISLSLPVPYDRDALTERSVFMSQIEVTYQVPMDKVTA